MGYYYHYDNVRDNYSSLIDKLEYQRGAVLWYWNTENKNTLKQTR
jgi:hypothetical protein